MTISRSKALSCLDTFNKLIESYDGYIKKNDIKNEAIETCAEKWGVSVESAIRYVAEGTYIDNENKRKANVVDSQSGDNKDLFPILCISDTHIPFEHENALEFCKDIYDKYNIKTVVHLGDLIDNSALSFHTNELDAETAAQEYERTKNVVKEWFTAFPNVYLCQGNHDRIPVRRAKEWGLPTSYIKSFHQLWNAPETWNNQFSHEIGGVKFQHAGKAGFAGSIGSALIARQSLCVGHNHAYGGVLYQHNGKDLIFGANGGCLINNKSYSFRYGRDFPNKPTLGCLVVHSNTRCEFIPLTEES